MFNFHAICIPISSSNLSNTFRDVDIEVDGEESVDEENKEVEQAEEGPLLSPDYFLSWKISLLIYFFND